MTPGLAAIGLCVAGAAILASLGTWLALGYSRRRAMLDAPGRRRSHSIPTPRGGGIGIVFAVLVATIALGCFGELSRTQGAAFGFGLLAVAAVGWIDDHRPLPAIARLLVHFVAATLFVSQLPTSQGWEEARWALAGVQILLLVTAINFWNFMDGIDGLVATQTVWVAVCVMLAFGAQGQWLWAMLAAVLAGACLGFLPFNFPRARIFLGDVGSGGLGFAIGALLLQAQQTQSLDLWSAALIVSALGLDATLTLVNRMRLGRRWYTAHREHLYQWLVRTGYPHSHITSVYLAWNLIFVLPLLWLSRAHPTLAPSLAIGTFVVGGWVWWTGKQRVLRRVRQGAAR